MNAVLARVALLGLGMAAPSGAPVLQSVPGMPTPRAAHSATLLADGNVLLAGGCRADRCENGISGDALLFEAPHDRFVAAGALVPPRVGQRAARLKDGSVVLIGGWTDDGATASVERCDPATGRFADHGHLVQGRDGFTATPLDDGTVLVVGGSSGAMQRMASAEIYDPCTGTSMTTGPLAHARMSHTATRLADGRVLIAGGSSARGPLLDSLEVYDPITGTFLPAGRLHKARHKHAAVRIGDTVMLVGGAGPDKCTQQFSDSESWLTGAATTTPGPSMHDGRYKCADSVALLGDDKMLVAGRGGAPELLDAASPSPSFAELDADLGQELSFSTAARLRDGRVLVAGGYDPRIRTTRHAWLSRPRH